MKKFLLGSGLVLGLLLTSFTISKSTPIPIEKDSVDCYYVQCYATAKSTGKRCRHCVSNEGDSYCWQHN